MSSGDHRWFKRSPREKRHLKRYDDNNMMMMMMMMMMMTMTITTITTTITV
jgi:hypothetical protein